MTTRVPIIYARLSREDLRDASEPLESKFAKRIAICLDLAHRHGLSVSEGNIFTERQSRTTVEGRDVLMALLARIRKGEISHFITPYADRVLGGDLGDVDTVESAFIDGDCKLLTTEKLTDFGHEDYLVNDAMMVRIKAVVDNQYVQSIIKKRKESNKQRTRDGQRSCGYAPYGYKWIPARFERQVEVVSPHYEVVLDEYTVLEEIFERIRHEGLIAILTDLNNRLKETGQPIPPGINRTSRASQVWQSSALYRILTNPHYAGYPTSTETIKRKGKRAERPEPLTSAEEQDYPHPITLLQHEEVLAILKSRRGMLGNAMHTENLALLVGILHCCKGLPMRSGGNDSYHCRCKEGGNKHNGQYLRRERIEEAAIQVIERIIEQTDVSDESEKFMVLEKLRQFGVRPYLLALPNAHAKRDMVRFFISRLDALPPTEGKFVRQLKVTLAPYFQETECDPIDLYAIKPHYLTERAANNPNMRIYPCDCGCGEIVSLLPCRDKTEHHFYSRECYKKWRKGKPSTG